MGDESCLRFRYGDLEASKPRKSRSRSPLSKLSPAAVLLLTAVGVVGTLLLLSHFTDNIGGGTVETHDFMSQGQATLLNSTVSQLDVNNSFTPVVEDAATAAHNSLAKAATSLAQALKEVNWALEMSKYAVATANAQAKNAAAVAQDVARVALQNAQNEIDSAANSSAKDIISVQRATNTTGPDFFIKMAENALKTGLTHMYVPMEEENVLVNGFSVDKSHESKSRREEKQTKSKTKYVHKYAHKYKHWSVKGAAKAKKSKTATIPSSKSKAATFRTKRAKAENVLQNFGNTPLVTQLEQMGLSVNQTSSRIFQTLLSAHSVVYKARNEAYTTLEQAAQTEESVATLNQAVKSAEVAAEQVAKMAQKTGNSAAQKITNNH